MMVFLNVHKEFNVLGKYECLTLGLGLETRTTRKLISPPWYKGGGGGVVGFMQCYNIWEIFYFKSISCHVID